MNKRDPNAVIDGFRKTLGIELAEWRLVSHAARSLPVSSRKLIARDVFFRMAVSWEVFKSDWHTAATAKDMRVFRANSLVDVQNAIKEKKDLKGLAPYVRLDLPTHMPLSKVERLLDADGENVSLSSKHINGSGVASWQKRAIRDLAHPYVDQVSALTLRDIKVVSAVENLRDCLAHASDRSIDSLGSALAALDPKDIKKFGGLTRSLTATTIPSYLHSKASGKTRLEHFFTRVSDLAGAMRV